MLAASVCRSTELQSGPEGRAERKAGAGSACPAVLFGAIEPIISLARRAPGKKASRAKDCTVSSFVCEVSAAATGRRPARGRERLEAASCEDTAGAVGAAGA